MPRLAKSFATVMALTASYHFVGMIMMTGLKHGVPVHFLVSLFMLSLINVTFD